MSLSQAVAGGSRNADATRVFFPVPVDFGTQRESSAHPSTSHGWKWALHLRIWSGDGPKGHVARSVLTALLWSTDGTGRTWLGIPAIMEKSGLGSERPVRKALDVLAREGWIWSAPQTWSSLTAEQLALGRQAPRRGDAGQAPNVYTVLPSPSPTMRPDVPTRPNLYPKPETPVEQTPLLMSKGDQLLMSKGEPPATWHPDPDPSGSISRMESEERQTFQSNGTHNFSKAQGSKGDWGWLDAWNVIVHAHAERTKGVYGVSPLPPDLKRDERRAVAECLDGVATDLAAKLRARGIECELSQVRQDLAARVMKLYFKRDNEHLRRVKHALRDLPREFHARIIEAMQAISRESHEAVNVPRRTSTLELPTPAPQVEKAAQVTKSESLEKPLPVDVTRAYSRQALEMLGVATKKDEAPKAPSKADEPKPDTKQALPVRSLESVQEHANASPTVQRSTGRLGAPRWGAMIPTPTKVRTVSRLQIPEPEPTPDSVEAHPRK